LRLLPKRKGSAISNAAKAMMVFCAITMGFVIPRLVWAQKSIHTDYFKGTDYELNVYRIYGKETGKTLLLIGGIQGDEPGGYLSVDHYADISLAKGNLIVVPRANFRSIVVNRRKINDDMNRKFADDSRINYETKIVTILKKLIDESDCLLNLHDGSGFYSEKWEGPSRNPMRYGQSIIADCETYEDPITGRKLQLGDMGRSVCMQINKKIKNPRHHFHFNNHKTKEKASVHKEQRKSATYYALNTCGIPAFGVETSKSLPLAQKVRHHNLAINAFMERLDIVPETPGLNIDRPVLNYLVVSINDSLPVVVKARQSLSLNSGDTIMVSHVEANYERGLSVDIVNYGTVNDIRKKVRITAPTKIIVRKDYYPCGSVYLKLDGDGRKTVSDFAVSDKQKPGSDLFWYNIKINGDERIFQNYEHVKLIRGDKLEIVDVISGLENPSDLVVNLKGYVGDSSNNTGEDRGYVVDTGRDLWKRYSLKKKGEHYQVVVKNNGDTVGKLFLDLEDPALKYIVIDTGDGKMRCLPPGSSAFVNADVPLKLIDINTNVIKNSGVKAFITDGGSFRRLLAGATPVLLNKMSNTGEVKGSCRYRLEVEREKIFLGAINLNCSQEIHHEE